MADVLLGFLPRRCSTRGFLSWRAFSICRLKASSWRAMLGEVSSSPHSPMATQSGDAIFPSSQLQSTSSRALGCAPQVRSTFTWPTMAGMCASHSTRNTWLDTTASNPSTYDERCSCWKNGRMLSIVACMPDLCLNNSRWQWPSTTNARVGFDAGPWTNLAPDTCVRRSFGNSAIILIPVLQCSTADKSHGDEVAVVTVPPQYLTNCPHRTCLTTDCAGSRSAIQPRSWTTSPSFSQGTPKCSATTSNTAVMERNHVNNCWLPNLPSSSWTSQCFPCRWAWLLPLAWQCQQAFSGTQNHGKWMELGHVFPRGGGEASWWKSPEEAGLFKGLCGVVKYLTLTCTYCSEVFGPWVAPKCWAGPLEEAERRMPPMELWIDGARCSIEAQGFKILENAVLVWSGALGPPSCHSTVFGNVFYILVGQLGL